MERKLSALIIDDEENARKLLNKLLEETQYFSDIRLAQSVSSANNELTQFDPDLVFLDIKMPGKDGFSFIHDLPQKKKKPGIIFVTAYDQYAIKAIKNQAFDYLLKPVNRRELKQSIVKFLERKKEDHIPDRQVKSVELPGKITRIRVNTRTGTVFINPSAILYCKADGNYTTICTGEKQHLCSMNLGKVEEMLPGNGFLRIGRSYIINFEYITMLDRKESTVTLVRNGESVTVKIPRQHLKDLDIL
ncbi:MAG: LytTR family DNA-binding domain-containing protein [Bacteroidia bacterium]|nr:LytTR family DNA-binding domain-containing protein [Bacteroidia bacterium]